MNVFFLIDVHVFYTLGAILIKYKVDDLVHLLLCDGVHKLIMCGAVSMVCMLDYSLWLYIRMHHFRRIL